MVICYSLLDYLMHGAESISEWTGVFFKIGIYIYICRNDCFNKIRYEENDLNPFMIMIMRVKILI